jgi:hypothetical protein
VNFLNFLKLYGTRGRIVSGIAGIGGGLAAIVSAAQQAELVSILPPEWNKYLTGLAVVSLFITMLSERLQGGASQPAVRKAAEKSDEKNAREMLNQ